MNLQAQHKCHQDEIFYGFNKTLDTRVLINLWSVLLVQEHFLIAVKINSYTNTQNNKIIM